MQNKKMDICGMSLEDYKIDIIKEILKINV